MRVLVTTLGLTWGVIPEAYALLAPDRCPLYRHRPQTLAAMPPHLGPPEQVWVCTTAVRPGERDHIQPVRDWWRALGQPCPLRLLIADTGDASAQSEVELLRELIYRATLAAGTEAILCLAGGRKTMSADLQQAGNLFGCRGLLHVLPPEPLPPALRSHDFLEPLPPEIAIHPVTLAGGRRADFLDFEPAITAAAWPLPGHDEPWTGPPDDRWLWQAVAERQRQASSLLVTAHTELAAHERMANWRGLYRLPPRRIAELRARCLGPQDRELLTALPKAELHCHIGGVLDLSQQCALAGRVWPELPAARRQAAAAFAAALSWNDPWRAVRTVKEGPDRAAVSLCLLAQEGPETWQERLEGPTRPRLALQRHPRGFSAYELPGELSGSALLSEPLALEAYATAILASARRQGLRYLELRCSPAKYRPADPVAWLGDLLAALTAARQADDPTLRLLIIADRRQGQAAAAVIDLAVQARERYGEAIAGIDLAGDEAAAGAERFATALERAFAICLPITIHAGEGTDAAQIWQAAYRLHADRIGHGLSLTDRPDLARRFRDRRICLELCPTSNREVVGFADPAVAGSAGHRPYPLRTLLNLGVPCTLCTDNPGLSRTTLADEYLAAARMTPGGLSWWDALGLIRQGFLHAFCERDSADRLLVEADAAVCRLINEARP